MQDIKRGIIVSGILVTFAVSGLIFSPVKQAESASRVSATAAIDPFIRKPYSDLIIRTAQSHDSLTKAVHLPHQTTGFPGGPIEMQFTTANRSLGNTLAVNHPPAVQGRFPLRAGDKHNPTDSSQSKPSHAVRTTLATSENQNHAQPGNRVHAQSEKPKVSKADSKPRASFTVTFLLFLSVWLFFYNLSNIMNYKKIV